MYFKVQCMYIHLVDDYLIGNYTASPIFICTCTCNKKYIHVCFDVCVMKKESLTLCTGKNSDALKSALKNAPVGNKDPKIKVSNPLFMAD